MGKTEAVLIRRGLSLYKQPLANGRGSPNWYARVYMPLGGRNLHARSTGTTDQRLAQQRAGTFWGECKLRQLSGNAIGGLGDRDLYRFDLVAERWLDQKKEDAGTDSRRLRSWQDSNHIYLAGNGLAAFFGRDDVRGITTDRIREFLRFYVTTSTKGALASSTQIRTLVALRQILKDAFERRLISSLPLMPKIKQVDQPRAYFTRDEYRRLYLAAWLRARRCRENGDRQGYHRWMEMSDFVVFMVSTFLRASEWSSLQHRHVTVIEDGPTPHISIAAVRGKTGARTVLSMPEAIPAYRRIIARTGGLPDAYLFKGEFLNRQTATEKMRDSFELLLRDTKLKVDALGKKRVIHSLRHSAIMFRILEGDHVDHLVLAKNAGTSIDQIERFYASHLQVSMKLANLQSNKAGKGGRR